jgi:hypothetical protein
MALEVRSMIGIVVPPTNPGVQGSLDLLGALVALFAVLLIGAVLIGMVLRDSHAKRLQEEEPRPQDVLPRAA